MLAATAQALPTHLALAGSALQATTPNMLRHAVWSAPQSGIFYPMPITPTHPK